MKKQTLYGMLGFLSLLGLVGVGVYFLFFCPGAKWISSMTAKVGASGKKAAEALAVAQEPENTALTMKAAEILKYAGEKPDDSAWIVALCEEFFKNFKTPKYEIEKTRLKEIQASASHGFTPKRSPTPNIAASASSP